MKVFVCGLESSGQRWVRSVFAQHPYVEVCGDSFPCNKGENRQYPVVGTDIDWVVIVVRDATCQGRSVENNGYNEGNEGSFSREQNMSALMELLGLKPVMFISYETAVQFKQKYWNDVFDRMNLPKIQVNTQYLDGNQKYFTPCDGESSS